MLETWTKALVHFIRSLNNNGKIEKLVTKATHITYYKKINTRVNA